MAQTVRGVNEVLKGLVSKGLPFSLFRLPGKLDQFNLYIQHSSDVQTGKPDLSKLKKGFLVSPFSNPALSETMYFEAESAFEWNGSAIPDFSSLVDTKDIPDLNRPDHAPEIFTEEKYIKLVTEAVEKIKDSQFKKVVLGRFVDKTLTGEIDLFALFQEAAQAYSNAFVNICFVPQYGLWFGATPELLIKVENNVFETVAMAGTQSVLEGLQPKNAVWSQKEIEEQALVARYIVACFKSIRLREYEENGPRTIQAGSLLHLKTEYKINIDEEQFPGLGTTMLGLLHPTSAVCGMPLQEARAYILQEEGFDRSLFSGFWGPVNGQKGEACIYVNIRCLQMMGNIARFYAAAGITEDSSPEKEWLETGAKLEVMGRFFK